MCIQVFHTDILIYYAEQKASGREFPESFSGDDIYQVCPLIFIRYCNFRQQMKVIVLDVVV